MSDAKNTLRKNAAKKLLAIYGDLPESKRLLLEELLLQHAFLCQGTVRYMDWAHSDECPRRTSYLNLLDYVSEDAANAWFEWAALIQMENSSLQTVRMVLLDFLRSLVVFRHLEGPMPTKENIEHQTYRQKIL